MKYQLSICKCPSGKYDYVGSVPIELCQLKTNHIGQKYYASPVFDTEQDAKDYANKKGIEIK